MRLPEPIRHLPDDQYLSVGYLRKLLADAEPTPEVVTISQAVERWSYSRETWRQAAVEGDIPGAWQDTEGGTWRLPVSECRRYVRLRQARANGRGSAAGPRGPRALYEAPRLQEDGQVLARGPAPVGREAPSPEGSHRLRLAP